ncbi:MAG: biotin--[acetyl-CoA-carboxylase] ligase [Acidobacteria bacterium]|nr:MAG: biotin--[acetyl-CoA-carboxylase] ligase [Acidobacteriota bacterium]REK00193.1 MAG: biotin--[acetyl-CoA-carboxylase] ligase [Acidobacteriota bacterium]
MVEGRSGSGTPHASPRKSGDTGAFEGYARAVLAGSPVQVAVVGVVDSTNRLLRAIAHDLAGESPLRAPFALIAWRQEAGRGRLGRSWASDAGMGVYLSLFWPLEDPRPEVLHGLPLRVGSCLNRGLVDLGVVGCRLKWPNDLLVSGRKLGGILLELVRSADAGGVVIGVGVNVAQSEAELVHGATSIALEAAGEAPTCSTVALCCLSSLQRELATSRSLEEIVADYRSQVVHREGDPIGWRSPDGERSGSFAGIDDQGALLLRTEDGVETVHAGDVVLRERPAGEA